MQHPEQLFLADKKRTAIIDAPDRIHIMEVSEISKLTLLRHNGPRSKT